MKNVMFSIGVGAALGAGFSSTFAKANQSLDKINENYKQLRVEEIKNSNAIKKSNVILDDKLKKEKELRLKMAELNAERQTALNRIKFLTQEMKKNNGGTKEQQKEYSTLQEQVNKLSDSYKKSRERRNEMAKGIREERGKIKELGEDYKNLTEQVKKAEAAKKRAEKIESIKTKANSISSYGTESMAAISGLLANREKMNSNINNTKDESMWKESTDKEAATKVKTTENSIVGLQSQLDITIGKIGKTLLPTVLSVANAISDVVSKIAEFQAKDPEFFDKLVKGFLYGSVALVGLGGALKVASVGMKTYAVAMAVCGKMSSIGFAGKIVSSMGVVSKVVMGFTGKVLSSLALITKQSIAFLVANPIAAAIAVIIGVSYLLYRNWDTIKNWTGWKKIKEGALEVWEVIKKLFEYISEFPIISQLINGAKSLGNFFGNNEDYIVSVGAMSQGNDNFTSDISTLGDKDRRMNDVTNELHNQNNSKNNFIYSPNITTANPEELRNVLKEDSILKLREFEKMFKKMEEERVRTGRGR